MLEISSFALLFDCCKFCLSSEFASLRKWKEYGVIRILDSNLSFCPQVTFQHSSVHLTSLDLIVFLRRVGRLDKMIFCSFLLLTLHPLRFAPIMRLPVLRDFGVSKQNSYLLQCIAYEFPSCVLCHVYKAHISYI